jgi:dTDP-4-amino-4,6-dideoxygalactose transaminase
MTSTTYDSPVPLVDLASQHAEIAGEVAAGFERVIESNGFIGGPDVAAFESEFASYQGVSHCVGVGNGTDALEFALRAAGVGTGDEVILPANTFVATAEAVVRAGATPVLVDSDPDFHLVDVGAAEAAVGPRTAALLPVHLYGRLAPMEGLGKLAAKTGLAIVEDAAQAQGATSDGRRAGSWGLATGTSFYPGKNLGAYGDAGAVLSNDSAIDRRVRLLANHGSEAKYQHIAVGFNSRLDSLQAVVLRAKLARLERWNDLRRAAARRYDDLLRGLDGVSRPRIPASEEHVWHLYVVRVPPDHRDALVQALNSAGIGAAIHYPVPIHLQEAFAHLPYRKGDFPIAEQAAAQIMSLPLYPHLTAGQQERVVETLAQSLRSASLR